jgi:hypothetical protein
MMDAIRSSETSVLTRDTRRELPEDGFPHSHRRENLKSYTVSYVDYKWGKGKHFYKSGLTLPS